MAQAVDGISTIETEAIGQPASMLFCPLQASHDLIWKQTRAAAVENRGLTA